MCLCCFVNDIDFGSFSAGGSSATACREAAQAAAHTTESPDDSLCPLRARYSIQQKLLISMRFFESTCHVFVFIGLFHCIFVFCCFVSVFRPRSHRSDHWRLHAALPGLDVARGAPLQSGGDWPRTDPQTLQCTDVLLPLSRVHWHEAGLLLVILS